MEKQITELTQQVIRLVDVVANLQEAVKQLQLKEVVKEADYNLTYEAEEMQ